MKAFFYRMKGWLMIIHQLDRRESSPCIRIILHCFVRFRYSGHGSSGSSQSSSDSTAPKHLRSKYQFPGESNNIKMYQELPIMLHVKHVNCADLLHPQILKSGSTVLLSSSHFQSLASPVAYSASSSVLYLLYASFLRIFIVGVMVPSSTVNRSRLRWMRLIISKL
jgi:hypothetical protein